MPHFSRRRVAALAALAATGAAVAAIATPSNANANPAFTYDCAGTVVLAVDGTKGPTTPGSIDPNSPLNGIADLYRDDYNTAVYHVAYPGGLLDGIAGWDENYNDSVRIGKSNVRNVIRELETKCDGTPIQWKLLGFSQGAEIVGDVATEIDSDQTGGPADLQDRTEVFLYADPRQGIARTATELAPGVTFAGPRLPYQNVTVHSICAPGDLVCDPNGSLPGYFTLHVQGKGYQP